MTVPTTTEINNYAATLNLLFGHDENGCCRIADLCDYVARCDELVIERMRFMLGSADCPLYWRVKTLKGYPHPMHLPGLSIKYEDYRRSIMVGRFNHVEEVFWTLGALFRSIKPFNQGNAIIGHLIENHARQHHNLPWRFRPLDQRFFRTFHQSIFQKHYAVYLA